jgi:hypothetical protein
VLYIYYDTDETGLFFNLHHSKTLTLKEDSCHGGTKSKQQLTVLLASSADGSDILPSLVNGKYRSPRCFKNVKRMPTKYEANIYSWMTTTVYKDLLIQLDRKLGARNRKILRSLISVLII